MGFGVGSRMLDLRMAQTHKRSESASFPEKKRAEGDKPSNSSFEASQRIKLDMDPSNEITSAKHNQYHSVTESSLKQEIDQLKTRLQDQFKVRCAFETALGYGTASSYMLTETNGIHMPKPAIDLIKDIAVLEMDVIHLEQHLLSLYRKAFDQQISSVSPNSEKKMPQYPPVTTTPTRRLEFTEDDDNPSKTDPLLDHGGRDQTESSFQRSHSHSSAFESKKASTEDSWSKAIRSCHSRPLYVQNGENVISLAEHLGTRISYHFPETANKLSEEMVKCMSEIYCKLSEPPSLLHERLSSSDSSLSSPSDQYNSSSPGLGNSSSLDDSFRVEGEKKGFSGPYSSTTVEVLCIYRDAKKASEVEHLLQHFKSLISRLEEVDPSKLKHEEKLAFWINVHNALVMHAFLAYGIPQNNPKRVLLLLKAAYNVGGNTVSAEAIQSPILGCKRTHPGQWLRLLFASKKFKAGDDRLAYAIDHSEPLLHFALTSGSHSDPPVRVYTPKKIQQELETSKEDYIRMNLSLRNQKIQLPKLVETFAKESGLCPAGLREMVNRIIPESSRTCFKRSQSGNKSRKAIDWIPHSFTFRYLILREAAE